MARKRYLAKIIRYDVLEGEDFWPLFLAQITKKAEDNKNRDENPLAFLPLREPRGFDQGVKKFTTHGLERQPNGQYVKTVRELRLVEGKYKHLKPMYTPEEKATFSKPQSTSLIVTDGSQSIHTELFSARFRTTVGFITEAIDGVTYLLNRVITSDVGTKERPFDNFAGKNVNEFSGYLLPSIAALEAKMLKRNNTDGVFRYSEILARLKWHLDYSAILFDASYLKQKVKHSTDFCEEYKGLIGAPLAILRANDLFFCLYRRGICNNKYEVPILSYDCMDKNQNYIKLYSPNLASHKLLVKDFENQAKNKNFKELLDLLKIINDQIKIIDAIRDGIESSYFKEFPQSQIENTTLHPVVYPETAYMFSLYYIKYRYLNKIYSQMTYIEKFIPEDYNVKNILRQFKHAKKVYAGGDFVGWNFEDQNLRRKDLRQANFLEAKFSGADLSEAKVEGASFRKANLLSAHLEDIFFNNVTLHETKLHPINFGIDKYLIQNGFKNGPLGKNIIGFPEIPFKQKYNTESHKHIRCDVCLKKIKTAYFYNTVKYNNSSFCHLCGFCSCKVCSIGWLIPYRNNQNIYNLYEITEKSWKSKPKSGVNIDNYELVKPNAETLVCQICIRFLTVPKPYTLEAEQKLLGRTVRDEDERKSS